MKEAVTKVIDTLTQEDFDGAFQKLLERYKCIPAGGDYFEGDLSFMCVLSIKVPIRKKSGNLLKAPRNYGRDMLKVSSQLPYMKIIICLCRVILLQVLLSNTNNFQMYLFNPWVEP